MPQHKGAERRVRLSEKRRHANKGVKTTMRKMLKEFDPKASNAGDSLKKLQSSLDKLARKGIIKKNFAANKKSKLARSIKKSAAA